MNSGFRTYLFVLTAILLTLSSCSGSRPAVSGKKDVSTPVCGLVRTGEISWYSAPADFDTAGLEMPSRYALFTVDTAGLRKFFTTTRKSILDAGDRPVAFPLSIPLPEGCVPFSVSLSGATPRALVQKYPDMLSLQGNGVERRTYDLRLDWDGLFMRGLIQTGGQTLVIQSLPARVNRGRNKYYIYDRVYSTRSKSTFESPAGEVR